MQALHEEADALIRAMYLGRVGWAARERARELKLRAVFATVRGDTGAAAALHRLIYGLHGSSRLVAIEPVLRSLGPQAGNTGLDALLQFARCHEGWLRPPEEWTPDMDDRRGQVGSLAQHLFVRYPVPAFLFLVNHPELPLSQVGPVTDYVRSRKCGSGGDDPPEPDFTMKGRTVEALSKRMAEWHEALARLLGKGGRQSWSPSGIAPLERIEKDPFSTATCCWRVAEITTTLALAEEGRAMKHCVRSYQNACLKGETSIWSLRVTFSGRATVRRLLTIEVNNHLRAIVQVRGNCNQPLSDMRGHRRMMLAREVLRDWARQRHLGIACSL